MDTTYKVEPTEILRNIGMLVCPKTPLWRRSLLIESGGRKRWVVAHGPTHKEATERVYAEAEELKAKWSRDDEPTA